MVDAERLRFLGWGASSVLGPGTVEERGRSDRVDPGQFDGRAAEFAELADGAPVNELYERPAMLELVGDVAGLRVLELGTGGGWYAEHFVRGGATVTAIDASPAMLEVVRERCGPSVTLRRADLNEPLPELEGEPFDLVLASLVLHFVEDWGRCFAEVARRLAPGGAFALSVPHPLADLPLSPSGDYLRRERVEDTWQKQGREFHASFWRRPLGELFAALGDAGLWVDSFVEPLPVAECASRFPRLDAELRSAPMFCLVRALRPTG